MCAQTQSNTGDTVYSGTGEFQIKDVYVRAEVEVCSGTICKVNFSSPDGQIGEAVSMVERLKGQPVAQALAVNPREIEPGDHATESPSKVALLEAFHRAVEACFDSE